MKNIRLLLFLPFLFLFTSCFQKKAYIDPLCAGVYTSTESFIVEQKEFTGTKLIVTEITLKEFNDTNAINALQDFSLKAGERKYYSFQFYFLNNQEEFPVTMKFEKKCNPHATGPNVYIISIEIPDMDETLHYSASLIVNKHNTENFTEYYLGIDATPHIGIHLKPIDTQAES